MKLLIKTMEDLNTKFTPPKRDQVLMDMSTLDRRLLVLLIIKDDLAEVGKFLEEADAILVRQCNARVKPNFATIPAIAN